MASANDANIKMPVFHILRHRTENLIMPLEKSRLSSLYAKKLHRRLKNADVSPICHLSASELSSDGLHVG